MNIQRINFGMLWNAPELVEGVLPLPLPISASSTLLPTPSTPQTPHPLDGGANSLSLAKSGSPRLRTSPSMGEAPALKDTCPKIFSLKVWKCYMCDSLWSHGLQPTRLLCPWYFPGKKTGVGCQLLLQGIFPTQGSSLQSHALQVVSCTAGGFLPSQPPGKPVFALPRW